MKPFRLDRRQFLHAACCGALASTLPRAETAEPPAEPIIDIHQHPGFMERPDERILAHQRAMGVTMSFLLPAGTPADLPSTDHGKSNGLAAKCSPVEAALKLFREHPESCRFFANEPPDHPEATRNLEKYLSLGAIGIGEQKFHLPIDSPPLLRVYDIARAHGVPILMHFQQDAYNLGYDRFHKILERYPTVNFIGHAQTFWGHIDGNHNPSTMYPKGTVKAGGITDRLLSDYPNMYADHSAGSGLNALTRDEDHARAFLERHQDKLMFGSDCYDVIGRGPGCRGATILTTLKRLSPNRTILRKILFGNASRVFQIPA